MKYLALALAGLLCGCSTLKAIADYGKHSLGEPRYRAVPDGRGGVSALLCAP